MISNNFQSHIKQLKKDFPVLKSIVHGKNLVYLDNAATTLKPQIVIDSLNNYYSHYSANVHRGIHYLSEKSSVLYEESRKKIQDFINAKSIKEIIFTSGTTDSINLLAYSYGRHFLKKGDEIIISEMEHHSNLVPWQILCQELGCKLLVAPINDQGELDIAEYKKLFSKKTKLVAVVYTSNSLGTINPVKEIVKIAHENNTLVILDAAQTIAHLPIDVQDIDCDFLAFSGHKVYGPTGIGVLYGKEDILKQMPPFKGGGDMISEVSFAKSTYNELPYKFEAGTPSIAGAIGLGQAIDYIKSIAWPEILEHEKKLLSYGTKILSDLEGLTLIGTASEKVPIFQFVLKGIHAHDVGTILDEHGIAVRSGHHCTMPVMKRFGVPATVRASLSLYNSTEDIDELAKAILAAQKIFYGK